MHPKSYHEGGVIVPFMGTADRPVAVATERPCEVIIFPGVTLTSLTGTLNMPVKTPGKSGVAKWPGSDRPA